MSDTLIRAHEISVKQAHHHILNNVSLEIKRGDFITIIGPNGAGKSMLIKALMGFYRPHQGTISRHRTLTFGYMPQHFNTHISIPITAQRFLTLNRSKTDYQTVVHETDIDTLLTKQLHTLSGGEVQRILLARALLNNPDLLILDEPTQNLDLPGQLAFYQLLARIYKQRGLSVLMVSHDLHMVMSHTQKVICLFHHICCSGEPHIVAKDPEFISLFGKDMANLVSIYHHYHDHHHHG